ncbi:hypothetical protein M0R45_013510 [Rubus argutus]|uniref:Uncharacterized protein n=1 Tax=Rubus argutus TaxID=59490 RepID=A0AAW1XJD2_RUBAR
MACGMKPLVVVISLSWVLSMQQHSSSVHGKPQVPCFFIFGDSLADNGNNNLLDTLAKVNYRPYGIDFSGGVTGRFSNGQTTVDVLSELMGFDNYIPPFSFLNGSDILKGVNYASGAAGIRKETGKQLGARISMRIQLKNHKITVSRIVDIVEKYYHTSKKFTTEKYAEVLIKQYSGQILRLYKYGARKPNSLTKGLSLVDQLNSNFTNAKFIYINSFEMGSGDPAAAGFTVSNVGCCSVNEVGQCKFHQTPCKNRTEYVFWDGFHPTEALNRITAIRSYSAFNPADTYPMDISQLVQLKINPGALAT